MLYRKLTRDEVNEYRRKMAFIVKSMHDFSADVIQIFTNHHQLHVAACERGPTWKKLFFRHLPIPLDKFMQCNCSFPMGVHEPLHGFRTGYIVPYYYIPRYEVIPDFTKDESKFMGQFKTIIKNTTHQVIQVNNFIRIMDKFGDEKPRLNEVEEINYLDWIDLRYDDWLNFSLEFKKD